MSKLQELKTLHEQITDLLMENGCAVTKPAIDEMCRFIAKRDQAIIRQIKSHAETFERKLQLDEHFGTQVTDLETL
jgi:hypothetical protein